MPAFGDQWRYIYFRSYIFDSWPTVDVCRLQTPADCLPIKIQIAKLSQIPQTVYAGDGLKNSDGSPIEVELIDRTGSIVSEGLESSAEVTAVVLERSIGKWIEVEPRDGKPPLLAGCVTVPLKEGKACFDDLRFTDNSSFVRDKKFQLGFKTHLGSQTLVASSKPISVKDKRGKCKFQWPFLVCLPSFYCSVQHVLGA
jgi:hypothetical protein